MSTGQMQQRNAQNVRLLSADLQPRYEPNFAWKSACSAFLALPALRGFWPMSSMDYTAANRAIDISGQGNHLTDNNTVEFGYDSLAPYVHFTNASTEYLSRADGGAGNWADITGGEVEVLAAYRGLTFGGWFYFDTFPATQICISKGGTLPTDLSYRIDVLVGATPRCVIGDGVAFQTATGGVVAANTWMFLVGRFIPSTQLDLFINDVMYQDAVGIPATLIDSTTDFCIGARSGGVNTMDGRASLCFLCAAQHSDAIILSLFHQTRALFGV